MKIIMTLIVGSSLFAVQNLETKLKGTWRLKAVSCNQVPQPLDKDYTLSFSGKNGQYVSKTKSCTQEEPEIYSYLSPEKIGIKSGVRKCSPNPCEADLPATECGKETNPATPEFSVSFSDGGKTMTLATSDPKSVDCIGPGSQKPAVFTFVR